MSSEDPQMWYGDARNYYFSSSKKNSWLANFDPEIAFWGAVGIGAACLASFGLLFLWYQAVWNIFLGIPTPSDGAEVNTVEIFAFVTTVILLFAIVTAVCVTTNRIKRAGLDHEYRMRLAQQDHELQIKVAEAQKPALPPAPLPVSVASITGQIAQLIRQGRKGKRDDTSPPHHIKFSC